MFKTTTKVTKEGKTSNEEYIVLADTPSIAEAMLMKELEGITVEKTTSVTELKVNEIFENGEGVFYECKVDSEDEEGIKMIKETFIQEANNFADAYLTFTKNVDYGYIRSIKELKTLGIIK